MSNPLVSILILTYNSEEVIGDCVAAVSGDGYDPAVIEIIVVDNSSTDASLETATRTNPNVLAIQSGSNDGFAAGVSIAAEAASGRFLLLLNPDAVIEASTVLRLAESLESSGAAIGAPLVVQGEGEELRTIGAGRAPTAYRMFLHASGLSRLGARVPALEGHYLFASSAGTTSRPVDWVSGGCLMVRSSSWHDVGGLSRRWFMYAEDIDFCLRVGKAGGAIMLFPQLRATHAVGGSSTSVDGRVNPTWIVNLFDLYCISIARSRAACQIWKLVVCAGFAGRLALYRAGKSPEAAAHRRRYGTYISALWHTPPSYGDRDVMETRLVEA